MAAAIELKGIVNRFGPQVVHDGLDLSIQKGEVMGLVGGSGSGKSVLLRTILGLNKPAQGQVLIGGKDIHALPEEDRKAVQKKWGVLFQDGALFSGFSVLENIEIPLREHTSMKDEKIEQVAREKLELAGLPPDSACKFPSQLSGGMVRRAGLARALALEPELLFLDEPTGALDPVAAAGFDDLLLSLRREKKLTILLITHDLDTLTTVCDRVAMLVDKKLTVGTVKELMKSTHPDIHEFFNGPRMHNLLGKKEA